MRLQERGDLHRTGILLADAEFQSLHTPQQEIGGHWVESGPIDFTVMVNLLNQRFAATDHAAQGVAAVQRGR